MLNCIFFTEMRIFANLGIKSLPDLLKSGIAIVKFFLMFRKYYLRCQDSFLNYQHSENTSHIDLLIESKKLFFLTWGVMHSFGTCHFALYWESLQLNL